MNIQTPPPERDITRHDNQPPLPERIIIDFDAAIAEHEGLGQRIDDLAAKADEIDAMFAEAQAVADAKADALGEPRKPVLYCRNADMAGRLGDTIKMCAAAAKAIEDERETLNRPLLQAQRGLKAHADGIAFKATNAAERVRVHLNGYLAEVERRRIAAEKAEAKRLHDAEVARLAEQKRLQDIEDAKAETERKRLQAIADEDARVERDRLQAIEDERAAAEKREATAVVVEAEVVKVEAAPVFVVPVEPEFVAPAPKAAPIRGDYGTTIAVTTTWHAKVVNMRQLPDLVLKHPEVVAAAEKVVGAMVRGKNGIREMKGVEITSTTGGSVR